MICYIFILRLDVFALKPWLNFEPKTTCAKMFHIDRFAEFARVGISSIICFGHKFRQRRNRCTMVKRNILHIFISFQKSTFHNLHTNKTWRYSRQSQYQPPCRRPQFAGHICHDTTCLPDVFPQHLRLSMREITTAMLCIAEIQINPREQRKRDNWWIDFT